MGSKVIGLMVLAFGFTACHINVKKDEQKRSYSLSNGFCTTSHEFTGKDSQSQMCAALQDDGFNCGCAASMRQSFFTQNCGTGYQPRFTQMASWCKGTGFTSSGVTDVAEGQLKQAQEPLCKPELVQATTELKAELQRTESSLRLLSARAATDSTDPQGLNMERRALALSLNEKCLIYLDAHGTFHCRMSEGGVVITDQAVHHMCDRVTALGR